MELGKAARTCHGNIKPKHYMQRKLYHSFSMHTAPDTLIPHARYFYPSTQGKDKIGLKPVPGS